MGVFRSCICARYIRSQVISIPVSPIVSSVTHMVSSEKFNVNRLLAYYLCAQHLTCPMPLGRLPDTLLTEILRFDDSESSMYDELRHIIILLCQEFLYNTRRKKYYQVNH
jgi:hypothetical protein